MLRSQKIVSLLQPKTKREKKCNNIFLILRNNLSCPGDLKLRVICTNKQQQQSVKNNRKVVQKHLQNQYGITKVVQNKMA